MGGRGGVEGPVERPEGGAEAGEGLPASAATRPPPGKVDEGTSLPVRGGEGSGGSRRGDCESDLRESGLTESGLRESSRTTCLIDAGSSLRCLMASCSMRSASLRWAHSTRRMCVACWLSTIFWLVRSIFSSRSCTVYLTANRPIAVATSPL